MRIRTGGSILTPTGWVVRTTDEGPARGRVEGQRGYAGMPVHDLRPTSGEQRCPTCGSQFGSQASLSTHRSRKHRERAG